MAAQAALGGGSLLLSKGLDTHPPLGAMMTEQKCQRRRRELEQLIDDATDRVALADVRFGGSAGGTLEAHRVPRAGPLVDRWTHKDPGSAAVK